MLGLAGGALPCFARKLLAVLLRLRLGLLGQPRPLELGLAGELVGLAGRLRQLRDRGLPEVPSTRLLVAAARLVASGVPPREACRTAVAGPLTDDPDLLAAIHDVIAAVL